MICGQSVSGLILVVAVLLLAAPISAQDDHDHAHDHDHAPRLSEEEKRLFEVVTCSSIVKLKHVQSDTRLHSHKINYGTGSGQQSVTGYPDHADGNSFWAVRAAAGKTCQQGTPLMDGDVIRLEHLNTNYFLHSHLIQSPLSSQQEVSAYEGVDTGDNWKVEVIKGGAWRRGEPIRLLHLDTNKYLYSSTKHKYQQPISGQLEVSCVAKANEYTIWQSEEGIYFPSKKP